MRWDYREFGHTILYVWYVRGILRLHVLYLGQRNDNDEQKVNGNDSVTRAYMLLYVVLLAKGSNHSLHEFVVSHSWTELLQILYW